MSAVAEFPVILDAQVSGIAEGSPASIAAWVETVARDRGITFRRRPSDLFATAAARLSDAEVEFDEVEQLLLALERARVITPFQRGLLQVHYLR